MSKIGEQREFFTVLSEVHTTMKGVKEKLLTFTTKRRVDVTEEDVKKLEGFLRALKAASNI